MGKRIADRIPFIVSIDPGLSGAIALTHWSRGSRFVAVYSMPTEAKKSGRRQVDVLSLIEIFEESIMPEVQDKENVRCVIEQVSAMPGQGVSGMFSLGDSFGAIRSTAQHYSSRPISVVSPVQWKRSMGLLKKKKTASLTLARRLYPAARASLARRKDEGRAEALLIGHFARLDLGW